MNNSQDEDQGGVTMRVEMQTGQGLVIKIYRVKLTTSMQKVIDKVFKSPRKLIFCIDVKR